MVLLRNLSHASGTGEVDALREFLVQPVPADARALLVAIGPWRPLGSTALSYGLIPSSPDERARGQCRQSISTANVSLAREMMPRRSETIEDGKITFRTAFNLRRASMPALSSRGGINIVFSRQQEFQKADVSDTAGSIEARQHLVLIKTRSLILGQTSACTFFSGHSQADQVFHARGGATAA